MEPRPARRMARDRPAPAQAEGLRPPPRSLAGPRADGAGGSDEILGGGSLPETGGGGAESNCRPSRSALLHWERPNRPILGPQPWSANGVLLLDLGLSPSHFHGPVGERQSALIRKGSQVTHVRPRQSGPHANVGFRQTGQSRYAAAALPIRYTPASTSVQCVGACRGISCDNDQPR